jgi:hypothetical protein
VIELHPLPSRIAASAVSCAAMRWLWPAIVAVAAAAAIGGRVILMNRSSRLPGFSKDRKGRCHYRVWGIERASGARCVFHIDAKTPVKAEQEVADQGIAVEGVLEVPRLHKDPARRASSAKTKSTSERPS